jgi:sugar phosphate isomerase/epimerase
MKLAFSTNAFTRFTLIEAIDAVAAAGFDGIEILADKPHAYVPDLAAADRAAIRAALGRNGLAVSNVNANCTFGYWSDAPGEPYFEPSLLSPVEKHRRDRTTMIRETLAFAAGIGAKNVSITSGRCLGNVSPTKAAGLLRESLLPLLDAAEAAGVDLGLELEPGLYLEWIEELRTLIGEINHPRLGANLDVGHAVVNGERIDEAVLTLAGHIWNLHVEDLPGRKHYHQTPGDGTFDWPLLARVLARIHYDRFVTVELYTQTDDPHAAARQSHAFLKDRLTAAASEARSPTA